MGNPQDKTEVTEIPIDKIRPARWQPRETFDKEKIEKLGESLKEKGIIQPIVVRKNKTGDGYQIIAGERRWRAWEMTGKKTIPAVIKDVDDFTAKELSIIENWHREDLTDIENEKFIYDLYMQGVKDGKYTSYADMERKTGISHIGRFVDTHIERNSLKKSPQGKIIEAAPIQDLEVTRSLKTVPEAREELLKIRVEQPEKMSREEMRKVVNVIKDAPPEKQAEIVKLIAEEKLEPKQVENFVKVLKESPPDVREKLIRMEITPDEAEEIKIFKTPEQRAQIMEERKVIAKSFENDKERLINIRKQMADEVEAGVQPTIIHTGFDARQATDEVTAERTLEYYQGIYLKVIGFRESAINSIKDVTARQRCINYVKLVNEHCIKVLVALGEIKEVNK